VGKGHAILFNSGSSNSIGSAVAHIGCWSVGMISGAILLPNVLHDPIPGKKTVLFLPFYICKIILPRQARDKHRETSRKSTISLLSGPQPAGDGLSSGNARHRGYHGFLLWRRVVLLVPDSPRAGGQGRNILLSLVSFPDDEEATFAKTGSGRMQDESFEMRQDRFVHSHFYKTLPIVLWDSKAACLLLKTAVRNTRSFGAIDKF
jgi:hypothetical protein